MTCIAQQAQDHWNSLSPADQERENWKFIAATLRKCSREISTGDVLQVQITNALSVANAHAAAV